MDQKNVTTETQTPTQRDQRHVNGGRSQPTGKPDVDQGKNPTPGAQPGQTHGLQNERDGTRPVQESGERITPPHGDELAEVAHDAPLDRDLSNTPEGSTTQDPNSKDARAGDGCPRAPRPLNAHECVDSPSGSTRL